MPQWHAFSQDWHMRWERVDGRCRFTELAGSDNFHAGEGFKRTAQVFGELPTLRLKYQSLLARFDSAQAADLDRIERELDRSRDLFLRARKAGDEEAP